MGRAVRARAREAEHGTTAAKGTVAAGGDALLALARERGAREVEAARSLRAAAELEALGDGAAAALAYSKAYRLWPALDAEDKTVPFALRAEVATALEVASARAEVASPAAPERPQGAGLLVQDIALEV